VDGLGARGLAGFVDVDVRIVRGLAYYTGTVFEVFDRGGKLRAIAGGGRYDNLINQLSNGAVSMPALGFAMGDVVLGELLGDRAAAGEKLEAAVKEQNKIDIYVVIAKEQRRPDALEQIQVLRDRGYRVDYSLTADKVAKQFQTAENVGAQITLLYGDEWPQVKVKNLATREESLIAGDTLLDSVTKFFNVSGSA
jgi:histidyl-tRNA synthetase